MLHVAILIAKLIDPVIFIISLIGAIATRRYLFAPLIAILAASAHETVLHHPSPFRMWGETFIASWLAALTHTLVMIASVRAIPTTGRKPSPPERIEPQTRNIDHRMS